MSKRITVRITVKPESRLERHVKGWINGQLDGYDSAEGVLKDLFYGGCSSGMVGHLVYTPDCVEFFKKHRREIAVLLAEILDDCGTTATELFCNPHCLQWDKTDPLGQEDNNRNLLAWFGFEETARRLADRQGIEA